MRKLLIVSLPVAALVLGGFALVREPEKKPVDHGAPPAPAMDTVSEDTPEARAKAVDVYLKAMSVREVMDDMTENMMGMVPANARTMFRDAMKEVDMAVIEKAMRDAMVKHFTVKELNALAAFYGTREGKSAMKKMGKYMADAMPAIQAEIGRAMQKVQQKQQNP